MSKEKEYEPYGPEWKKEMNHFTKSELIDSLKDELLKSNAGLLDASKKTLKAIHGIHKVFGAPGDYGYGTQKGDALNDLYASSGGLAENINKAEHRMRKIKKTKQCRVCGCTNNKACPGGCYWIEDNLCSQCKS